MDRRTFFDCVRGSVFRGRLSQTQVDGLNHLLDVWQREASGPDAQLAYCLATSFHETAHTMRPVRETLAVSDAQAIRRLDAAWRAGRLKVSRPYWRDGFFGRGHVQLTHKANYQKMGAMLGIDLAGKPSLALDADISARILFAGMLDGAFTGKRLDRYVTATRHDFRGARRTVNGMDKAGLIAGYAEAFLEALKMARAGNAARRPPMPDPEPDTPLPDPSAPDLPANGYEPPGDVTTGTRDGDSTTIRTGILQTLIGSLAAILGALGSLTPWLAGLIVVLAVAAGLWIWKERRRHAREDGI